MGDGNKPWSLPDGLACDPKQLAMLEAILQQQAGIAGFGAAPPPAPSGEASPQHARRPGGKGSRRGPGGYSGAQADKGKPAKPPPMPAAMTGLSNLGNTCFMNSVLQVLMQTPSLVHHLTDGGTLPHGGLSLALCVFARAMEKRRGTVLPESAIEPLHRFICERQPDFKSLRQQDAQELLRFLIHGLEADHAESLKLDKEQREKEAQEAAEESSPAQVSASKKKREQKKRKDNVFHRTFGGAFYGTVTCHQCKGVSRRTDAFQDLSCEIPQLSQAAAIEAAEEQRTRLELLREAESAEHKWRERKQKEEEAAAAEASRRELLEAEEAAAAAAAAAAAPSGKKKKGKQQQKGPAAPPAAAAPTPAPVRAPSPGEAGEDAEGGSPSPEQDEEEDGDGIRGPQRYVDRFSKHNVLRGLLAFFAEEQLAGETAYACGPCAKEVLGYVPKASKLWPKDAPRQAAVKQCSIGIAPVVFVLHLKRFKTGLFGPRKIDGYVPFPLEFCLDPFASPDAEGRSRKGRRPAAPLADYHWVDDLFEDPQKSAELRRALNDTGTTASEPPAGCLRYSLYGVVVHLGQLNSGHYVCYVRPYDNARQCRTERWYHASDTVCREASVFEVLRAPAYMLLYERI